MLCLEIWRGANHGGSFMHSMQSSFSLGALLSPLVAQPFLSVRINQTAATTTTLDPEVTSSDGLQTAVNSTAESSGNEEFSESSIYILYAFNGLILSALAMPFLYLGLKEVMQNRRFRRAERSEKQSEEEQHEQPQNVIYSVRMLSMSAPRRYYVSCIVSTHVEHIRTLRKKWGQSGFCFNLLYLKHNCRTLG